MRILSIFLAFVCGTGIVSGADFYVSNDGKDEWTGTHEKPSHQKNDGPFATLERAREAVRKLNVDG